VALHFDRSEYSSRIARALAAMAAEGLDGLLMFQQESMYYLTGYDSFGFCFFQCLYLGADGRLALLTRSADLRQALHTSIVEDIRIWTDTAGARPADQLKDMLESLGCRGKRLGIETDSYGLTHFNGKAVEEALAGFCKLAEASALVGRLRTVKSPAELACVRKAGRLADEAFAAALRSIKPGADEGDILAAMQGAIFRGGGDYPANEFIIGSGRDALLCRYKSGRRRLRARDQLTLEWAGVHRHYHAALMRTVIVGKPSRRHLAMDVAAREALAAVEETLCPGRTAGDAFEAHAKVMAAHGMERHMLNACGYSLGARFSPSWMDRPMFYRGNAHPIEAGMVLFAHMILMDSEHGQAYCLGRTSIVGAKKPTPISRLGLDMVVR
jgi:Xaa-Pro dipeptidase